MKLENLDIMEKLLSKTCVPCSGQLPPATDEEINRFKTQVPDWNLIKDEDKSYLQKVYQFPDFKKALAFTQAVGDIAEQEGHHPAITTEWGKVTVAWWTHAINGLHQNDFIMAAKTDNLLN